jgi:hypothetical protein
MRKSTARGETVRRLLRGCRIGFVLDKKKNISKEKRLARKPWPKDVEARILIESRRVCAFCHYFENDNRLKMRGQIAHVDRDPSNVEPENGAYLCKEHHDEYDSVSTQSKRLNPAELKEARESLHVFFESGGSPSRTEKLTRRPKQPNRRGVSLAVYERRLPIYKVTIEFIRYVVRDLKPDYPQIIKFGHDTEEALFLFGEQIAQYLAELSKRAVRLHAVMKMREAATYNPQVGNFEALISEETSLAAWFTDQYDVTRREFAPFLRLE